MIPCMDQEKMTPLCYMMHDDGWGCLFQQLDYHPPPGTKTGLLLEIHNPDSLDSLLSILFKIRVIYNFDFRPICQKRTTLGYHSRYRKSSILKSHSVCPNWSEQRRQIDQNSIWLKKNRTSDNEGKLHSFLMCRILNLKSKMGNFIIGHQS